MKSGETTLLTSGNPAKRIIVFALPLLAGELIGLFYTMTDAFIVGRWLGINGLAAVGIGSSIIHFIFSFILGLTSGFTVITAQRVGSGDEAGIRRSVATGIILSLFLSILLMVFFFPLSRPLLSLMKTPVELMENSSGYVLVLVSGISIFVFYNLFSGIIIAGGNSFSPLIFYISGIASNVILDILFVVVFSWGVRGAAAATVLAELIPLIMSLFFMFRRFRSFLPRRQDWFTGREEFSAHFSLGLAMALQRCIVEVGNILVQASLNTLGALNIAAVSAAQRVRALNMTPVFAVSRAVTTYTAQNYGAKKLDRVYRGVFQACLISLGLGFFMAILNQFTGTPLVSLFLKDSPEAVALATQYILFTGYTVFILGIMLVFRSTLQGLGLRRAPILCGVMETVMSVFAAFVLIPRFGFIGVCLVNPLSWLASGIPLYIAFGIFRKKNAML